ncbi:MAG: pitrilysin family protein [Pirellulaceae bacterium]
MKYRTHKLENGLTILAEVNDSAYFAGYGFFVRTGARDESPEIAGVSHFLEHMVFKGTERRTAEQVNRELDDLGSSSNARTGEESTIYHASVLPEFQGQVVDLLCDIMRPSLRVNDFETEKKVIIEEIMMYQDQPPYGGHERLLASYFGNHPLGQSVLGTVDTVSGLSASQMMEYFHRQYSPGNMALVAAGNVDFDRLVDDATRHCGGWEPFEVHRDTRHADVSLDFDSMVKEQSAANTSCRCHPAQRPMTLIDMRCGSSTPFWAMMGKPFVLGIAGFGACRVGSHRQL